MAVLTRTVVLTPEELLRYGRQIALLEVGTQGQKRLKSARVLIVGVGGLGSPASLYLAAAGVGTLGLVDDDVVDHANLQRQILFSTGSVGRPKLVEAQARLEALNPNVTVLRHETRLTSTNALDIIGRYDLVADGTDNFPTRYLVNDACALVGKPNVYASIYRFEGQVSVFDARRGPCYRCLHPEPPPPGLLPDCAAGGVLGALPGVVGALQAVETIKLLLGVGEPLIGRLLLFDALKMEWRKLALRKDPRCPLCATPPSITRLADYEAFCGARPARAERMEEVTVEELKARLDRKEDFFLLDVREPHEYELARIPGSTLIPLGRLPERVAELDPYRDKPILVHCKLGGRSAQAVRLLREKGFAAVLNVAGGIDAWSERVDPSVPRY